jgi:hypothetical protein
MESERTGFSSLLLLLKYALGRSGSHWSVCPHALPYFLTSYRFIGALPRVGPLQLIHLTQTFESPT